MHFTDIFIKRPVLATVVSLLIFLMGLSAMFNMQIREYPKMNNTLITVSTSYPGADADLIAGFITTPLESALASAEGIDYMTSTSVNGMSSITINVKLDFPPEIIFTDVMSKVQQTLNQLPPQSQNPIVYKTSDVSTPLLYVALDSKHMSRSQMSDYAIRVIQPELQTIEGVAKAEILGQATYAMRIFLNPDKLAAAGVSPADVFTVLGQNNYLTASGSTKGPYVGINIDTHTNTTNVEEFKQIIVKTFKNANVHLGDIATVELGAQNYDSSVTFDDHKAVIIAITPTPNANPITVNKIASRSFERLKQQFPPSLNGVIVYDATKYIKTSIKEVVRTIIEASVIVIVIIFLFLGNVRAVIIPVVTIPLSLIGVCTLMLILGYSINLLTLLAFVLAIGLVVDDAIVVVENVHRHIEEGLSHFEAALKGAREIAVPVIGMTITLASVYTPIGFMTGLTGALFKEFAFTLASSVIISGIIALTLSPMMCSLFLKKERKESQYASFIDKVFEKMKKGYQKMLTTLLTGPAMILVLITVIFFMLPYLYTHTPKETAPEEDKGYFYILSTVPEYATINYVEAFTDLYTKIFKSFEAAAHYIIINVSPASGQTRAGLVLKPWQDRVSQKKLKQPLQERLNQITGIKSAALIPPALPGGGGGAPIQFVIKTINDFESLKNLAETITQEANKSGLFMYVDNSLKFNRPEVEVNINRAKAADIGLNMQSIGSTLSSSLSGGYVNYFNLLGRSYQVIPQLDRKYRQNPQQLGSIYVAGQKNVMIPLSTVIHVSEKTQANSLTHFQQLNAATIQGVMRVGYTLGDGLHFLQQQANKILPKGYMVDYAGQSRQFMQEGSRLLLIAILSILIIFLVLAAQYESFRDPLIILVSVPLSICGALLFLNFGFATINIYTQVGLITLIGLISKHGILIVDFANHLQAQKNIDKHEAVIEAATIRLRPILMTTAAMVAGVFPLLIAAGPGAVSRFNIGLVISTGLLIGTLFTLFVVPTMYYYLASDHRPKKNETLSQNRHT